MDDDILFDLRGKIGLVTLNRPKALNALTAGMCSALHNQLGVWARDDRVKAVVVVGAGDKAFCAGGDVVRVSQSFRDKGTEWRDFFTEEYKMNVAIDEFPKPYVSLVDGITMGGGVGISIPGDFWVATDKTLFAMPETGLGLFPDVGGGWFLPRLPGQAGMYLALTGARVKAADLYALGVASHVIRSDQVPAVVDQLAQEVDGTPDSVDAILAALHSEPGTSDLAARLEDITSLFSAETLEEIITGLEDSEGDWASRQADILAAKSPLSMKVTFRQLRIGATLGTFRENMMMEYRMVHRAMEHPDFHEGVRALLVDKDGMPVWRPSRVEDVSEAMVDGFFKPLDQELMFQ